MGSDANDRAQAIDWYRELAEESPDPLVDLHLAILEGEAGRLQDVQDKVVRWGRQSAPYPLFARFVQAGYIDGHTSPASAFDLQAHLAEQPLTGWFYSRLATRIAERSGDRPLLATIEASSQQRGEALLWRSRAFAALESALMVLGLLVLVWWIGQGNARGHVSCGLCRAAALVGGPAGGGCLTTWRRRRCAAHRGISLYRRSSIHPYGF